MFARRLPPLTVNHLPVAIGSHKGYTLVGIPGHFYHQQLENTLTKVRILFIKNLILLIILKYFRT